MCVTSRVFVDETRVVFDIERFIVSLISSKYLFFFDFPRFVTIVNYS